MPVPVLAPTQGAAYGGPPGAAPACDDGFSQLLAALLGGREATKPQPVKVHGTAAVDAEAEPDAAVHTVDGAVVAPEVLAVLQATMQPTLAPAEARPRQTEDWLAPATRAASRPAPPAAIVARAADGKPVPRGFVAPGESQPVATAALAAPGQPVQPVSDEAQAGGNDAPNAFQAVLGQARTGPTASGEAVATPPVGTEPAPALPPAPVVERSPAAGEAARVSTAGIASTMGTPGSSILDVEVNQAAEQNPAPLRVEPAQAFEVVPQPVTMERVVADGQPVAKPEAPQWLGGPEFREQLLTSVRLLARTDGGQAEMQLQPESLGRLHVSMQVHNGQINLHLAAESAQAREAIVGRLGDLADAFSSAGLTLAQVNVTVGDQPRRGPDWSTQPGTRRREQEEQPVEAMEASAWLRPLSLLDLSA